MSVCMSAAGHMNSLEPHPKQQFCLTLAAAKNRPILFPTDSVISWGSQFIFIPLFHPETLSHSLLLAPHFLVRTLTLSFPFLLHSCLYSQLLTSWSYPLFMFPPADPVLSTTCKSATKSAPTPEVEIYRVTC